MTQDTTPIYAIYPSGAFAANTYERLRNYLQAQLQPGGPERVSIPGVLAGNVTLLNGQVVPVIVPEYRGMYSWSTHKLVEAVCGPRPKAADAEGIKKHHQKSEAVGNFLDRAYYEIRNLGLAPQERAMNFAATNAFQVEKVFKDALNNLMSLESITTERSPICRPGSECWDVKLTFFDPKKRFETAKHVYRFTVDVSDVIPVTVGELRDWDVY